MWIARLTSLITSLAFLSTFLLAVAVLLAYSGVVWTVWMGQYGGWFFPFPLIFIVAMYLLRYSAGLLMLERGEHDAVLFYCLPRLDVSLAVGRSEAGLNRYAAAEAHRRTGSPEAAHRLLDVKIKAPGRRDVAQLLQAARAEALLDLGRRDEAQAIAEVLFEKPLGGARKAIAALEARLHAAPHESAPAATS